MIDNAKTTRDRILARAVADRAVPFVVAMTGNARGITYSGAAGEAQPAVSAAEDTVFRIFSMTKAVGSTIAMMMIERGKLDFDTPVASILPEFGDLRVLDGWNGDEPILRKPKTICTVRHLATHMSGLQYDIWGGDCGRVLAATGQPNMLSGLKKALAYPLMFDPGARWGYGIGIDWLGQVVEKVDGRRIDRLCTEELFEPLGMTDTTFEVTAAQAPRLARAARRDKEGNFAPQDIGPPSNPEVYGMGHALYSTAPDYLRFLRMFLNKGALDGSRVLSETSVNLMLKNHMGRKSVRKMTSVAPPVSASFTPFPGVRKTHSFGFMRNEADIPGMRSKGSQSWAGILNTHYWFDPAKDVAAVVMTQSLPFVEPPYMALYEAFERSVYAS